MKRQMIKSIKLKRKNGTLGGTITVDVGTFQIL